MFQRLTRALLREQPTTLDLPIAERVIDQTLAFLATCSAYPAERLVPSVTVDLGWHTFLLHTREYGQFCRALGGPFIHHVPDDDTDTAAGRGTSPTRTVDAIRSAGYRVDADLWPAGAAADCADEGNCSASGRDGDENTGSRIPR